MSIAAARLHGATVSFNQVRLERSAVQRNVYVIDHPVLHWSNVARDTSIGPYASLFAADVGSFSGIAQTSTTGALPDRIDLSTSDGFHTHAIWGAHRWRIRGSPPDVDLALTFGSVPGPQRARTVGLIGGDQRRHDPVRELGVEYCEAASVVGEDVAVLAVEPSDEGHL